MSGIIAACCIAFKTIDHLKSNCFGFMCMYNGKIKGVDKNSDEYRPLSQQVARNPGSTYIMGFQTLLEVNLRLATIDHLSNGYDGL